LPVPVKEENRTKCSREYLDPIHIEYERDNKNVKMRSSSICIHPLIFLTALRSKMVRYTMHKPRMWKKIHTNKS
jgi:hypothetical protein